MIAYDTGFHYVLPKIGSGGVADVNVMTEAATIAGRFLFARRTAAGLADYPGDVPASLDQAYQVQDAAIAAWGRPVIGWKVGRINAPLDQSLGADRLAGPIFVSKIVAADGEIPEMAEVTAFQSDHPCANRQGKRKEGT